MTRDLALVAYEARACWLLASGIIPTPWDELEPGAREMFRAEAKAIARAVLERLHEGLEDIACAEDVVLADYALSLPDGES